jgi:hypothetical protein
MKTLLFVICILTRLIGEVFAADCQKDVTLFLIEPSYKNYLELNKNNSTKDGNACWIELKRDIHNLAKLYKHAKQGNKWAIKILIQHMRELDGGELEDAYRALGESIDTAPKILLQEFCDGRMTEDQFTQAVEMLSLSFVDDKKGTLLALKTRKRKILSIKEAALKRQKQMAIKVIDSRIKEIVEEWP